MNRKIQTLLAATALTVALVGCSDDLASSADEAIAEVQLGKFQQSQPVPVFDYSQLRQNLIEIETAQANATATTSFMFSKAANGATGSLVHSCPSIGFPIPATYSLTNPLKPAGYEDNATIGQLEANGVYTGDTTATYVICVDNNGKAYAFYHEGDVSTVAGPAKWDNTAGEIVITGAPSAEFSSLKK